MRALARTWTLLLIARLLRRRQRIFIEHTDAGVRVLHPWTLGQGEL